MSDVKASDKVSNTDVPAPLPVLTASDILAVSDRQIEAVDVPEWGGRVYVRSMKGDERDAFDVAGIEAGTEANENQSLLGYRARLVVATACDADGKLLFAPHQVGTVGQKNAAALNRIVRAAQRINKIGADAAANEKKGSNDPPSGGSPTGSP